MNENWNIAPAKPAAVEALEIEYRLFIDNNYGPQWGEQENAAFSNICKRLSDSYDAHNLPEYERIQL